MEHPFIRSHNGSAFAVCVLFMLAALPAGADPSGDVRVAAVKLAGASSYEMTFTTAGKTATIDVIKPNTRRLRLQQGEFIFIDSVMYGKQPGRGWMKMPMSAAPGVSRFYDFVGRFPTSWAASSMHVTDVGTLKAGGEAMHAYRATDNGSLMLIYVAGDGYIHRVEVSALSTRSDGYFRFSKFNAVPPIHAPL
jgi:hypothetical protein